MTASTATLPPQAALPPRGGPSAPGPELVERGTVRHDEVRSERWVVRGLAKVAGRVEVGAGEIDGTAIVGGPFSAGQLTVVGRLEAHAPMTVAGRLSTRGALEAGGPVHAAEADLQGPVHVAGELSVDGALRVRGALRAPSVRCGPLKLRGTANIAGAVVASSFNADLLADSAVGTVQCRQFQVRGPSPNLVRRILGVSSVVTVERVDAEEVRIEGARVRFVRAAKIVLGRNAHVAALEGAVVRAHRTSRVGPESWSRPPLGLSR